MITHLSIQGLAIIDSLAIELTPGFNVITGETGAGKSILIRGLNFLMGAKATSEAIRQGYEHATVVGQFVVPQGHPALEVMDRLGIDVDYADFGASILIRRQISNKGRSQSWVNDTPVTSAPLRELGSTLVDVFGQHENQRLMDETEHTDYIDGFLPDDSLPVRVSVLNRECLALVAEMERNLADYSQREKNRDYLAFRLEELKKFAPTAQDFEAASALCRSAESSGKTRETLAQALQYLDGEGAEVSPGKALREAARLLGQLSEEPRLGPLRDEADEVARRIDDLSFEVGKFASGFDFDEAEVEAAQARLYGYQDLFRKHGVKDIEPLLQEGERLERELSSLESAAEALEDKLRALLAKAAELVKAANELTHARRKAAASIKRKVEAELQELAMPGSSLDVQFSPVSRALPSLDFSAVSAALVPLWEEAKKLLSNVGDGGNERGEFLLASNPGEPPLPLAKIASGGEMSRIMLALKKALVADAETCVLVFDEIDSGISGRVADVVGRKMQELASSFQVICISHLPQVAVYADTHLLVKKGQRVRSERDSHQEASQSQGRRTESTIVRLTREESAREIARLLSGAEVSPTSLANALSLIERARALASQKLPAGAGGEGATGKEPGIKGKAGGPIRARGRRARRPSDELSV